MGDYLHAAKAAASDAMDSLDPTERSRLLQVSTAHAQIAIAESLRALVGVMASLPVENPPEEL